MRFVGGSDGYVPCPGVLGASGCAGRFAGSCGNASTVGLGNSNAKPNRHAHGYCYCRANGATDSDGHSSAGGHLNAGAY